jgi:hypothetical protein
MPTLLKTLIWHYADDRLGLSVSDKMKKDCATLINIFKSYIVKL